MNFQLSRNIITLMLIAAYHHIQPSQPLKILTDDEKQQLIDLVQKYAEPLYPEPFLESLTNEAAEPRLEPLTRTIYANQIKELTNNKKLNWSALTKLPDMNEKKLTTLQDTIEQLKKYNPEQTASCFGNHTLIEDYLNLPKSTKKEVIDRKKFLLNEIYFLAGFDRLGFSLMIQNLENDKRSQITEDIINVDKNVFNKLFAKEIDPINPYNQLVTLISKFENTYTTMQQHHCLDNVILTHRCLEMLPLLQHINILRFQKIFESSTIKAIFQILSQTLLDRFENHSQADNFWELVEGYENIISNLTAQTKEQILKTYTLFTERQKKKFFNSEFMPLTIKPGESSDSRESFIPYPGQNNNNLKFLQLLTTDLPPRSKENIFNLAVKSYAYDLAYILYNQLKPTPQFSPENAFKKNLIIYYPTHLALIHIAHNSFKPPYPPFIIELMLEPGFNPHVIISQSFLWKNVSKNLKRELYGPYNEFPNTGSLHFLAQRAQIEERRRDAQLDDKETSSQLQIQLESTKSSWIQKAHDLQKLYILADKTERDRNMENFDYNAFITKVSQFL
ncbi:hypothetical protein KAZ82_00580 [Candidatus Babeliales bacterium]|nr:hypothetical protein [Candidatus Babeliales bacterium]